MRPLPTFFPALALAACAGAPPAPDTAAEMPAAPTHLPAPIAAAYRTHTAALPAGRAIAYDLALSWGGDERFGGRITQTPSMDRLVMRRGSDGAELRYDGQAVALVTAPGADSAAVWNRARFDAFTWPYFFAAPLKLADPGTRWAAPRDYPWADGQPAPAAKLTFAPGTGDAPDDYYVVFPDRQRRVAGMAYVVTFGKPDADVAELTPPRHPLPRLPRRGRRAHRPPVDLSQLDGGRRAGGGGVRRGYVKRRALRRR